MPEVGVDETSSSHPLDLGHRGLGVHLTLELGRLVPLHPDGVLGAHRYTGVV